MNALTWRWLIDFRLPLRFLRGDFTRLALTVIALALGVALVCAIDLVNRAVLRAFTEIIDTMAGRAALQVSVNDGGFFPEALADAVGQVPGVEMALPVVAATAFAPQAPGSTLTVQGFDVTNAAAVRVYSSMEDDAPLVEDSLVFLNHPDSVVITNDLARRNGLAIGSSIAMDAAAGRRSFIVRGLLEPRGIARAYGGNLVVMDLYAAQEAFTRRGFINRIDVVVAREAAVATVADRIRKVTPGLQVDTPAQRKADLQAAMQSLQVLLQALALVALVAAFMIAFNRVTMVFDGRAWEMGVLRAVGVRRLRVCRELIKEAILLGVAGVVVGLPLGYGLGRVILPVIAATTELNYRIVAPQAELRLSAPSLILAVALGMGVAVGAALLPAWRASGVSVAETVRRRGSEQPERTTRVLLAGRVLILIGVVAALVLQWRSRQAVWGVAATVFLVLAAKIGARPIIELLRSSLVGRLSYRYGPVLRFVAFSLSRRPRQSSLAIATVGIGLGTVIWLAFVAHSFETTMQQVFSQAMRADLVVSSANAGGGALEMPVDDRFAVALREVKGVASVVGVRLTNWRYGNAVVVLDTFDPEYFRNPEFGQWPLLGERLERAWEAVAEGNSVVVSSNFVQNFGVDVGGRIRLDTPNGALDLTVVGVTTDFASPQGTIEMSRETYVKYWNDANVTRFFVEIVPGTTLERVRDALGQRLHATGLAWRVISSGELVAYWAAQVRRAFASVFVLGAVILAVVLFGVLDSLSAGVAERTREFGICRALGLRRRTTRALVVGEALAIAASGLVLALGLGLAVGALWVEATIPYILGWVIHLHVPFREILAISLLTALTCCVAALLPARRVARLEPAAAVRWE